MEYGIIGNLESSALVSSQGSIDWCCFPYLDSPSHFGALLDENSGGKFQISPHGDFRSEQHYLSRSQVVETFFETATGRGTLTDWMPIDLSTTPSDAQGSIIYRRLEIVEGKMSWLLNCSPKFRYGVGPAQAELFHNGILFRGEQLEDLAVLLSEIPLEICLTLNFNQG